METPLNNGRKQFHTIILGRYILKSLFTTDLKCSQEIEMDSLIDKALTVSQSSWLQLPVQASFAL